MSLQSAQREDVRGRHSVLPERQRRVADKGSPGRISRDTQETLELAAIVHDIACPLCREKYGSTAGPYQGAEGIPLAGDFYLDFILSDQQKDRICYLVGHHHTFQNVEGMDYQILVEADFLVNASESHMNVDAIENFGKKVFKTETGRNLLSEIYKLPQ